MPKRAITSNRKCAVATNKPDNKVDSGEERSNMRELRKRTAKSLPNDSSKNKEQAQATSTTHTSCELRTEINGKNEEIELLKAEVELLKKKNAESKAALEKCMEDLEKAKGRKSKRVPKVWCTAMSL